MDLTKPIWADWSGEYFRDSLKKLRLKSSTYTSYELLDYSMVPFPLIPEKTVLEKKIKKYRSIDDE